MHSLEVSTMLLAPIQSLNVPAWICEKSRMSLTRESKRRLHLRAGVSHFSCNDLGTCGSFNACSMKLILPFRGVLNS